MVVDKNSVSYMQDYLNYAMQFEKYVYIWETAMRNVNARLQRLCAEENRLEQQKAQSNVSLQYLDAKYERQKNQKQQEAQNYKKSANKALAVILVDIVICVLFGIWLVSYALEKKGQGLNNYSIWLILLIAVIAIVAAFFLTFVGPIFLGIYTSSRTQYKRCVEELTLIRGGGSQKRTEILLQNESKNAAAMLSEITGAQQRLRRELDEISAALQQAKQQLSTIYAENCLPEKYRRFNAVATLYEYLETGRCTTVQGHGGIYDTYENELRLGLIVDTLVEIRDSMLRMEATQQVLCQELRHANRMLSGIGADIQKIEKTNAEIAKNTAISAAANQQTAAVAKWMAWRDWANGNY